MRWDGHPWPVGFLTDCLRYLVDDLLRDNVLEPRQMPVRSWAFAAIAAKKKEIKNVSL